MQTYEFEGKTTEEAIENAARKLNIPVEELGIEILEPGSAGIFGLVGTKKAKIKVIVESPEEPSNEEDSLKEDSLKLAKETLENILAFIPIDTTVNMEHLDGNILLKIEGDKSGILIGRKGSTLDSLQYLVNKIVNKNLEKKIRVIVDSENYRERREESLKQMALKMGDKAKKTGKPVTINPLTSRDRRIIHLTLKDDQELETKSRGEGVMKKIVILPKR